MAICPRCGALVPVRPGQSVSCPACGKLGRVKPRVQYAAPPRRWVLPVLVLLVAILVAAGWMWLRAT